jgi:hypothetical protein
MLQGAITCEYARIAAIRMPTPIIVPPATRHSGRIVRADEPTSKDLDRHPGSPQRTLGAPDQVKSALVASMGPFQGSSGALKADRKRTV